MEQYLKIDELLVPPTIGQYYLVPCIVIESIDMMGLFQSEFVPIYNHPHNDVENGQKVPHYHLDTRVRPLPNSTFKFRKLIWGTPNEVRVDKGDQQLEYMIMEYYRSDEREGTHPYWIRKSKLKHNCIHKGKCPHRGYDLSSTPAVDGIITCPLHRLQFEESTGQLITKLNPNQ